VNAALAVIETAAPKNEIEAALAAQMAFTHTAAMAVLRRRLGRRLEVMRLPRPLAQRRQAA
jgi:hypothetical protein